jgi:hypothetical protein
MRDAKVVFITPISGDEDEGITLSMDIGTLTTAITQVSQTRGGPVS